MTSRAYISAARKLSPAVPRELEEYIASAYSSIRQEEAKSNSPHSYTTVRTLLSILRISAVSAYFLIQQFPCTIALVSAESTVVFRYYQSVLVSLIGQC